MPSYKARKQIILEALQEITNAANGLWEVAADLEEMKIDPDMLNKAITALELFRDGAAAHIASAVQANEEAGANRLREPVRAAFNPEDWAKGSRDLGRRLMESFPNDTPESSS